MYIYNLLLPIFRWFWNKSADFKFIDYFISRTRRYKAETGISIKYASMMYLPINVIVQIDITDEACIIIITYSKCVL